MNLSQIVRAVEGAEIVTPGPPDLARSALFYAGKWAWPVFPCKPRGKTPLTQHGFEDATCDLEQVTEWWTRWPEANIATPTGAAGCGYDVLDIDGEPGDRSLRELHEAGDIPDVLAVAFTPGDPVKDRSPGRHLYVAAQGQGNATNLLPGLDVRGSGGYVLLPPSVALHGVGYAWLEKPAGKP